MVDPIIVEQAHFRTIAEAVLQRSTAAVPRTFVRLVVKRRPPRQDMRDVPTIRMPRLDLGEMTA